MLHTLALLLQMQAPVPPAPSQVDRRDSVAAARIVSRARREEARLFWSWRHEWQKLRDLLGTDPRFWSLHCHADTVLLGDENNVIMRGSRKAMCPIWFQGYGSRADEAENIDNAIPAKSLAEIRAKRARVIAMLDSAARLDPRSSWVLGQRVRLHVDQKEYARALIVAGEECRASLLFCEMLEGYVLDASGNRKGAQKAFDHVASQLGPEDRCRLLDARVFLEPDDRRRYESLSCDARAAFDQRFWWLADPLWFVPGNERLAVHLQRNTLLILKSSLTADEHFDYRPKYGGAAVAEMLLRYGWPSVSFHHMAENENHNAWLGFKDSASNAGHEYFPPRYHTTPDFAAVNELATLERRGLADLSAPWVQRAKEFDRFWWPLEHIPRAAPLRSMSFQAASLRRANGPLVAVAVDPRTAWINASTLGSYTTALVAMRDPADSARMSTAPTRIGAGGAAANVIFAKPGPQVVSAEVLDVESDSAPTARARFAITAPPGLDSLRAGDVALSDIVLYAPSISSDSMPRSANDAVELMLPDTELRARERVGVFFELYRRTSDSLKISLVVVSENQPGLIRRFGARLGVGAGIDSAVASFASGREADSSSFRIGETTVAARSMVLSLSQLRPGNYLLAIRVERLGQVVAESRREIVIVR